MFEYRNINPKGRLTQDCVIRALSLFTDISYNETLDNLITIYKQTGFHIADPVCFMLYLQKFDCIKTDILFPQTLKLYDMCNMLKNNDYTQLININNNNCYKILALLDNTHLTYLENNVIIDTWDCSNLNVLSYFVMRK